MPCYHPLKAYRAPGGGVAFNVRDGYADLPVDLPCGQCAGCRWTKAKDWSLRCVHEAQLHSRNCFITLTYNDEHLPENESLDVEHWQLFAKKLRHRFGKFRFLHCGEYGELGRPHYHALLFGLDFGHDRIKLKKKDGNELFTSESLDKPGGKASQQSGI